MSRTGIGVLVLSLLMAQAGAADEMMRVLAEAQARGLLDPDVMMVNAAANRSKLPIDGSIQTFAPTPGPGRVTGDTRQEDDDQMGVTTGQMKTSVIGALNTAIITLAAPMTRAILTNSAENMVPVQGMVTMSSNGRPVQAQGTLGTSAIGATNFGSITVSIGQ